MWFAMRGIPRCCGHDAASDSPANQRAVAKHHGFKDIAIEGASCLFVLLAMESYRRLGREAARFLDKLKHEAVESGHVSGPRRRTAGVCLLSPRCCAAVCNAGLLSHSLSRRSLCGGNHTRPLCA